MGSYRRGERAVLAVNFGRPIVTNGDFDALLCGSVGIDRAVVGGGEWGRSRHGCIRCAKEKRGGDFPPH